MPTHVKAGGGGYAYWLNPEENKLGDLSKNFLFNVAEAKKLLSAAGHANGFNMEGYMNGGTEYGTSVYPQRVQLTIDQWKLNLNINVNLNRPPYAEFLPNLYNKRDYKGLRAAAARVHLQRDRPGTVQLVPLQGRPLQVLRRCEGRRLRR